MDPGLDLGMEKKTLVENWWNQNKVCNVVNGIVPVLISLDHCIMIM